jgi:hypothetical protein
LRARSQALPRQIRGAEKHLENLSRRLYHLARELDPRQ